jgi:hypothetical protein
MIANLRLVGGKQVNEYTAMAERHRKEADEFPMAFAFSAGQFEDQMKQFGLDPADTDKIYRLGDTGGFYKRTDAPKLHEMIDRHDREFRDAIANDTTGDGFIFEMFNAELADHEYIITGNVSDTLNALGLSRNEVNDNPKIAHGLKKAIAAQYDPFDGK